MTPFHYLHPDITAAQVAAELLREEGQRKRFYPRQVETMKMAQADADHQLACIAAWREDVARMEDLRTRSIASWQDFLSKGEKWTARPTPPDHGLTWRARRTALDREIRLRRQHYPRRIETMKLSQADAAHRIACLEALAARYDEGWDWKEDHGFTDLSTPDAQAAWQAHWATVEQVRNPACQQALPV